MVSDVLVGLLIGGVLMGILWPWKGGLWIIFQQRSLLADPDKLREHLKDLGETGESSEAEEG